MTGSNDLAGRLRLGAAATLALLLASLALAADNLQKQAQNPVADLITVPLQNNVNFNFGGLDRMQYVLKVQPVYPVRIGADWNLINRGILPLVQRPKRFAGDESDFGLGDLTTQQFFSPAEPAETMVGTTTWGIGPTFLLPTATDTSLGSEKWSAGAAGVVFISNGPWTYGGLLSQIWSFAGADDRDAVNLTTIQPILNYNLSEGWALGTTPIILANWEAGSDDRWTVPLGGGVSKLTTLGDQPVNFILRSYYNVVSPASGPDWQIQFQVNLLFPK